MRNPKIRVEKGDAKKCLKNLPEGAFHCVMTSPPVWDPVAGGKMQGAIGQQEKFDDYAEGVAELFDEIFRVLRADGSVFLHLADSFDTDGCLRRHPGQITTRLENDGWLLRAELPVRSHESIYVLTPNRDSFFAEPGAPQFFQLRWPVPGQPMERPFLLHPPENCMSACLRLATSRRGCCEHCGAPHRQELIKVDSSGKQVERKKSYKLARRWIAGCSCGLDLVPCRVLDPFYGSGTTGVVAATLGLDCYGIEINQRWIEMARKNLEDGVGLMFCDYKEKNLERRNQEEH